MRRSDLLSVLLVIPTYEPTYIHRPDLERFYVSNFDSFLHPHGNVDLKLVLSDFASSKSYKAFLRNYVRKRSDCFLIDGETEASRFVAFNIALQNFDYDYLIHGAGDLRTRDREWLSMLLTEFDDPNVQITFPTVTGDGERSAHQNQAIPLERESRFIGTDEQFNLHCPIFSRKFMHHFGNRYPDVFEWDHTENCIMFQLAAFGYRAKINFRVNFTHGDRDVIPLRPGNLPDNYGSRNDLREADHTKFLRRTSHLLYYLPTVGTPWFGRLRLHLHALKSQRWRYFYLRLFSRKALEDFSGLDVPTKEAILQALFYRPLSEYGQFSYSIYHGDPSENFDTGDSSAPASDRC